MNGESAQDKQTCGAEEKKGCGVCGRAESCPLCTVAGARRWNPYVVGVLLGLLGFLVFLPPIGKALGTSTTMVHLSGLATGAVAPGHVIGADANAYYAKELSPGKKNMFDWQFFLVIGVGLGAGASAWLARDWKVERSPELWRERFGESVWKRYVWAFIGGIILIFGARMAGGCTSGHGISGGLQMAVSSWTFFVAMFASGAVTALVLFGARKGA